MIAHVCKANDIILGGDEDGRPSDRPLLRLVIMSKSAQFDDAKLWIGEERKGHGPRVGRCPYFVDGRRRNGDDVAAE